MQSALLEAMQEKQVTIGDDDAIRSSSRSWCWRRKTPIEQEGTYPLPEAQVDRFMLKLKLTYPTAREEIGHPRPHVGGRAEPLHRRAGARAAGPRSSFAACSTASTSTTRSSATSSISSTRRAGRRLRARPRHRSSSTAPVRATIFLTRGARGQAFLEGRAYVTPQDIKSIGPDVMRHRLTVTYEAEAEEITAETILGRILDQLPVP